jgi:DNA polymerase-3 subunit epsilon
VVASLAERLRTELGVSAFGLRVGWTGRLASVDLTWSGPALATATLQEWVSQPPTQGGADQASSPQEVIARHGGEIWCGADDGAGTPGGVAYLRVLLPLAEHTPSAPAPRPLRVAEAEPQRDGLASYDFSLLAPSNTPGPWQDRPLSDLSFTVFDTETTGLFPRQGDEIISIGAVRIVNGRLLRQETFDQLVDPQRSVPDASVQIHGIRPEVLVGQPTIDLVLPGFAAFAEDTVLVGHNVAFDLQFLRPRRAVAGGLLTQPVLDTLLLSAGVHPEQDSHTLEAMADRLGVNVIGRHSALGDALVTGEVFLKLLGLMIERGIRTLGEAQEAAQQTYQARKSDSLYTKG